jgi:hypothetical protein
LGLSREDIRQGMRAGRFVGYRAWTGARWEWRISPTDDRAALTADAPEVP